MLQDPTSGAGVPALAIDWHGWRVRGMALHVGPLPGRKSIALYRNDASILTPLAYFKSETAASACLEFLDTLSAARLEAPDAP